MWTWAIVPLTAILGALAWRRAGRQSPERIHGKRGHKFGPDHARDHVENAWATYGVGRKGRFNR